MLDSIFTNSRNWQMDTLGAIILLSTEEHLVETTSEWLKITVLLWWSWTRSKLVAAVSDLSDRCNPWGQRPSSLDEEMSSMLLVGIVLELSLSGYSKLGQSLWTLLAGIGSPVEHHWVDKQHVHLKKCVPITQTTCFRTVKGVNDCGSEREQGA
jgi:hypothetical protein